MPSLVVQAEELSAPAAAWLAEHCELVHCRFDEPRFPDMLSMAEGLIVRTYCAVTEQLLAKAPRLRVVGRAGVGLDHIDVRACRKRSIEVVHTPDANTQAVVEFVLALLLDAFRPRGSVREPMNLADWNRVRGTVVAPRELAQKTLGVWGFGRIGSRVAKVASALGMRVLYHDIRDIPVGQTLGVEECTREKLLRESDIVTIHVDGRPTNRHILNRQALALLKPSACIVNAARGFLIDSAALAEFLRTHPSSRAILDVHDPEPIAPGYPLLNLPNATLTPHIAAATTRAHENMSWVVRDVIRVLNHEKPEFPAPETQYE